MAARIVTLCVIIVFTEAAPGYTRQKDFLDAFSQWLETAQAAKSMDRLRSGPVNNVASYMEDPDYWRGLALEQEQDHEGEAFNGELFLEDNWPEKVVKLGQIGGVAVNSQGDAVVFHRANRKWEEDSFKDKKFMNENIGPIPEPTVLIMNRTDGAVLDKWGQNLFYLPHGLTVDKNGNYWLTDVAMHQVFKFGKNKLVPELTLGKAFEPAGNNDDLERLCKPTDVAVASSGQFFVSDGYCNSRIIKYSGNGEVLGVFGQDNMWIPHSLALVEELDIICVADRENRRVLCYKAGLTDNGVLGQPYREYTDKDIMGRVFAITYSKMDGLLYVVTASSEDLPGSGLTIDLHTKDDTANDIIAVWSPTELGFGTPHDIEVTGDGANVYVGDLEWNKLFKFDKID